jgi:type IV secretory pathway VirJ component
MKKAVLLLLGAVVIFAAGALAATYFQPGWLDRLFGAQVKVTAERLVDVPVMEPDDDPQGLVILVSGKGGPTDTDRRLAKALVARDMVVLPVDLETYRKQLDTADGECMYLGSDIENIAKEALRTIGGEDYFHPVVAGIGEGGTLAYAAVADAPVATMAGAVALDPAPSLVTPLPTCPGATTTKVDGGGFSYALDADLPSPATLIAAQPLAGTAAPVASGPLKAVAIVEPDENKRFDAMVDSIVATAKKDASTNALPIVDIPATGKPYALALFYSGDGGWRDLDKEIGDEMATKGVHVVGIDSLRYFWSERTPQEIADEAVLMIERADPTGKLPVAIYGYSFGADTFPFAWKLLPASIQQRIRFVALLGTEDMTTFQVTVGGWLGLGGDQPVAPEIARIPPERVLCVYGEEEDDTVCTDPSLAAIEKLKTEGGHHFDEDYVGLAAKLLAAMQKRLDATQ